MSMTRRNFIGAAGSAALMGGSMAASAAPWRNADGQMMYGLLVHLGLNMWAPHKAKDYVRFDEKAFRELTDKMQKVGANMIVIDLGEACYYPSHPELAVKGTWSTAKMRDELKRLRDLGIEPFPKLNFSSSHDPWLKEYARVRTTKRYYDAVADVIADVCDVFDGPRFFHLGWDEEKEKIQRVNKFELIALRQGDLWWHDMLYTVEQARKHGSRGWIWSDKEWKYKDEFMKLCPRDVLQSHWYYSKGFGPKWEKRDDKKINSAPWAEPHVLCAYKELEEAGFDQIPCGSNIYNTVNFPGVVKHCLNNISKKHLFGFLNAPWGEMAYNTDKNRDGQPCGVARYLEAADQLGAAKKVVEEFYREKKA